MNINTRWANGIIQLFFESSMIEILNIRPEVKRRAILPDLWRDKLKASILASDILARAIVKERSYSISDIAKLKRGDILRLGSNALSKASIVVNDTIIYECAIGRDKDIFVAKIHEF